MDKSLTKPCEFHCHAPGAKAVFVAGTFNAWKPDATPLRRNALNGTWAVTLPLPPGHHEFKFVVDEKWCCEPGCEHAFQGCSKCVANEFGTMNRVLQWS